MMNELFYSNCCYSNFCYYCKSYNQKKWIVNIYHKILYLGFSWVFGQTSSICIHILSHLKYSVIGVFLFSSWIKCIKTTVAFRIIFACYTLPPCTCMSVFLLFVGKYKCYWSFWQKLVLMVVCSWVYIRKFNFLSYDQT